MTRINVGVDPCELCDQHLVAEYRELPRLWDFQTKSEAPKQFKLGQGHVLWCAQYQGMLADRYMALVMEMKARGFSVSYPEVPSGKLKGERCTDKEIQDAREIVLERIYERYKTMKKPPRWTVKKEK
jgi:hypothetical protein